jgi:small-conductance mechanosensitive channel
VVAAERIPQPGQLSDQEAVRTALEDMRSPELAQELPTRPGLWIAPYMVGLVFFLAIYALLDAGVGAGASAAILLRKLSIGAACILLILALARAIETSVINRVSSVASRYHLAQALRLGAGLLVAITAISLLSSGWYTTLASLGVISLILGLALQTPLRSLFGWIYIMVRAPYRIGDRIRMGDATGDVIAVGYLDTTLWEFGGPYLTTDHPSGRIIKFPNSKVLDETVYNYSWPLFPFMWNEIRFDLSYDSDLEFVARTMQEVAEEEVGEQMMERVRMYRQLLSQTPVDHLTVQERPAVIFRARNTWVEAILRYVVHPKETGRVRSQLTQRLLTRLNQEPDRVGFPRGNRR